MTRASFFWWAFVFAFALSMDLIRNSAVIMQAKAEDCSQAPMGDAMDLPRHLGAERRAVKTMHRRAICLSPLASAGIVSASTTGEKHVKQTTR